MNKIAKDLKKMIEKSTDPELFPIQKGRRIFVGSRKVLEGDQEYTVFDDKNRPLIRTRTKLAALAAARSKPVTYAEILRLDRVIVKRVTDCVFYEDAKKQAKDQTNLSILLEDSRMHIKDCREKLESFIFRQAK